MFEASAEVKRGGDRGSNQHGTWEAKDNLSNATQKARAKENGVHRKTQEKLDRLAKDRPDLLAMVRFNQMSVNKAAIQAGFVKQPTRIINQK